MNVLLYPKEPWISRRAAGIARSTGKSIPAARLDAENEHWRLQEEYDEMRRKTATPVLRLEPEQLFD